MRLFALLPILLVAAIVACGGADNGAPLPSDAPTSVTPIAGAVLVTRANDHGTVMAKVGDRIQVALGSDYDWRLDPPDGTVLVRSVQNQLLVRGTQALWTAAGPGTATISATGTVVCPSGHACILIALLFTTTVVVSVP